MQRILFAIFFMVAISLSSASFSFADSGWSKYTFISEITATNKNYYVIQLDSPSGNKDCKKKNGVYLDYDTRGSDSMFHILLNALVSKKKVRVYLTGKCELHGYSEISSVSIRP